MNRIFTEEVDSFKLEYLYNLSDLKLLSLLQNTDKKYTKESQQNYIKQLKNYFRFCRNKDYKYQVSYSPGQSNPQGRQYSKIMSFQGMARPIRSFLARDNHYDIDIVNSFPTIFLYICSKAHLPCKFIAEYVKNRDDILRDENITKQQFIADFLMSDKIAVQNTHFLKNLAGEIIENKKNIIQLHREILQRLSNSKTSNNPQSSGLFKILEYYENKILNTVITSKIIKSKDIISLCFDGMIVKNTINKELINKINELPDVKKYGVKFIIKKWDYEINIPEDYSCTVKDYDDYKQILEKDFALLEDPTMFIRISPGKTPLFRTEKDFRVLAAPYFNNNFKYNDWVSDPERKTFSGLTFAPSVLYDDPFCLGYGAALGIQPCPTDEKVFNQALPYKAKYLKSGHSQEPFEIFKKYLIDNITGEQDIDWFINFISLKLKNPNKQHSVAFVLKGEEGCGKDTLMEFFNKIYGSDRQYIYNQNESKHILGPVNTGLKNKLITVLNEMESLKGHQLIDKMKDMITRKTNMIEEKYCRPYEQDNNVTLFVFSNNLNPIKVTVGNRRWILFVTNSVNKGNAPYWKNLYELMNKEEWINNLFTSLMNHEIPENYLPEDSAAHPRSNNYFDMINDQIPPIIKFMYNMDFTELDIINEGKYLGWHYISKSKLKKLFNKYTEDTTKIKTDNILNQLPFDEEQGLVKNIRLNTKDGKRLGERILINNQLFLSVLKTKYFSRIQEEVIESEFTDGDKLEYIN